jgi:hypothetical protein
MVQTSPPLPPQQVLPTMYDLPSEDPEEPGLPDEFHLLQPELLRVTFRPPTYPSDRIFTASDLNLYYDSTHPQWYKRPDWFGVLGVSRFYEGHDLRLSYVTWQEALNPFVVVELLSPGTEKEDLGRSLRDASQPPNKRWYDRDGAWLPTPTDLAAQQAVQEKQRAELASQRAERLAAQLRALGVEPEGGVGSDYLEWQVGLSKTV